jgi:hypothetical protein
MPRQGGIEPMGRIFLLTFLFIGLPGTALRERGGSSEHTAAVEAQPGDDRALSKDRVRSG